MNMKLIKNTENISKEKITLFCLPFAGGGASAYNQWAKKMQGKVTVCPVQLPGREEQIMEKPYKVVIKYKKGKKTVKKTVKITVK